MAGSVNQSATGDAFIDGLLGGTKWNGAFSFSFPQVAGSYQLGNPETNPANGFRPVSAAQAEATRAILVGDTASGTASVMRATCAASIIAASIFEAGGLGAGFNGVGDIRSGESRLANPTAYAYFPDNSVNGSGGDVWYGTAYAGTPDDLRAPVLGNYAYFTHIHELGHSMGLKHAHETGGVANLAVPAARDAVEFTVMSYRSYAGGTTAGSYSFGNWDAPQTYMMYDILALQTMYGADYGTNNGATTYTWSPTTGETFINGISQGTPGGNKVFMTVWDGGGVDTYDMSNYAGSVSINLAPGGWSINAEGQRADLGDSVLANGTVYNSLLFQGSAASLIENATGGAANDFLYGNDGANVLAGGGGSDYMSGGLGNDQYYVDLASDIVVESSVAGGGVDVIWSSVSLTLAPNVEQLNLVGVNSINGAGRDGANDIIVGNEAVNALSGLGGDDQLYGAGGADQIYGGEGADYMSGGAENDYLSGGGGADVFFGGAGGDTIVGGAGDDLYYDITAGDIIVDYAGQGDDRILTEVSYGLSQGSEIETLSTTSSVSAFDINLTGNALGNLIVGNNGVNVLDGGLGNDALYGLGGGIDYFTFSTPADTSTNSDVIADWSSAGDIIFLDDAAFTGMASGFLITAAFLSGAGLTSAATAAQRVIHNTANGDLWWDQDGAGGLASVRLASVGAGAAVFYYDFFGI